VREAIPNILTVDLEDWFHVLEAQGAPGPEDWPQLESRVEANTERLLELFADAGAGATFFCLGWIAERYPGLVRRLVDAGHEVGSHSYGHEVLDRHDRASLSADLERSKKLLEDLSGTEVAGFRAPGGSITSETVWALEVVAEQGYRYDSSLCPGYSTHGGYPSPFHAPHVVRCAAGDLVEVPFSTVGVGRRRLVYAGGGYLRLFPYGLVRAVIRMDNRRGRPACLYVHPREIDPDQPRMALPPLRRFKYYVGLRTTERKLRALLREHEFVSVQSWIAQHESKLRERVLDLRPLAAAAPGSSR
jgi:polysaccharide deacetylase family protein (PEP-CTERM system associated)